MRTLMADRTTPSSKWLVSTEWLAARLNDPNTIVLDGSYYLPGQPRNARAEYLAGHIPGAVFFDIDRIADQSIDLPHMLPGPDQFAQQVGELGIGNGDTIVVYDGAGLFSAPRVWWTLRLFGAGQVFILDGGLPRWKAEGRPLESGETRRKPRRFEAQMDTALVAMQSDVQMALNNGDVQVVDARPADRFYGRAPEPRPGVRSGHMPGSLNVPSTDIVENGRLLAPERL